MARDSYQDVTAQYPQMTKWKWGRQGGLVTRRRLTRVLRGTLCFDMGSIFRCGSNYKFTVGQEVAVEKTVGASVGVGGPIGPVAISGGLSAGVTVRTTATVTGEWSHQAERCETCKPVGCHADSFVWEWAQESILSPFRSTLQIIDAELRGRLDIWPECVPTPEDCGCDRAQFRKGRPGPKGEAQIASVRNLVVVGFDIESLPTSPGADLEELASQLVDNLGGDPKFEHEIITVAQPNGAPVALSTHASGAPLHFAVLSLDAIDRARSSIRIRGNHEVPLLIAAPAVEKPWAQVELLRARAPVLALAGPAVEDEALFADAEWLDQAGEVITEAKIPLRVSHFTSGWQSLPLPADPDPNFALALRITLGASDARKESQLLPISP